MSLSPRARNLLRDVAQSLRREPRIEKRRTPVVGEVVAWCAAHDIELGACLTHARLRFDRDLLAQVDDTLAALGEPGISIELRGLTSAEQARHGTREEKSVRESPREHRVLASLPAGAPRTGIAARARDVLDIDWRDISLETFDVLVQVENLDSFYAFEPGIPALSHWPCPLVAYRGDKHYGGGSAKLAEAWAATGKPQVYAGDFDAEGVRIALGSQATHLLLPPLEWLQAHATAGHLPAGQMNAQAVLRRCFAARPAGHPLPAYLSILVEEQRGLKQQWFDHDLILVPLG
ncbi:hypothetical protein [Halomonas sp. NO4]|uniref:DUF7281 domain-containing protein n=1 Tax=Halomonas sp. NO4 TaxID=2484813 RepID=UPI0013D43738|nr:hypothetical protein [Halomonas sp. NO4]